jgi:hypothetical protein
MLDAAQEAFYIFRSWPLFTQFLVLVGALAAVSAVRKIFHS